MTFMIQAFGRGFALEFNSFDPVRLQKHYFRWTRLCRGIVVRQIAFASVEDGGLEFFVRTKARTQGWRLRGPVEHFEFN